MELRKRTAAKVLVDMYTAEANLQLCDSITEATEQKYRAALEYGKRADSICAVKDIAYQRQLKKDREHLSKISRNSAIKSMLIGGLLTYVVLNLIL